MPELRRDAMYLACAEVLGAAAQLGTGAPMPPPETLRQQFMFHLRQYVGRCRELGIPDGETAEGRYALVAFLDEQLVRSNWPGRAEWMSRPLQLDLYKETTAGENFYRRIRALAERRLLRPLEVYFLCVALGFVGAPPGGSGSQAARAQAAVAQARLLEGLHPDRIAPHAVPLDRRRKGGRVSGLTWIAVGAALLVCVAALVGLRFALNGAIDRAAQTLAEAPSTAAPPAASGR